MNSTRIILEWQGKHTPAKSGYLLNAANDYMANHMKSKKPGAYNGVVYSFTPPPGKRDEITIYVYHTEAGTIIAKGWVR